MAERLIVAETARLLEFLRKALPSWKRATLEQRIRAGCVRVNGTTMRRNDVLAPDDLVQIVDRGEGERDAPPAGIRVLHEDADLIAIDKPAGLLSVSTDGENQRTALALVRELLSRPGRPASLWPVHRLDRETSGVLLFARTRAAREAVQAAWSEVRKQYVALVEGRPDPPAGVIAEPLFEDRALFVRVGRHPDAKEARTRYATLERRERTTLLELELDTGRRHQIRAHLAWLGHPIVGDPRYGTAGARMELHAQRLELAHPTDGRPRVFEAPPPSSLCVR